MFLQSLDSSILACIEMFQIVLEVTKPLLLKLQGVTQLFAQYRLYRFAINTIIQIDHRHSGSLFTELPRMQRLFPSLFIASKTLVSARKLRVLVTAACILAHYCNNRSHLEPHPGFEPHPGYYFILQKKITHDCLRARHALIS